MFCVVLSQWNGIYTLNIRNGIYAEAYDAVNNKMNTHYGFYIQSDKVEEQEKEIELFFYALRMIEEE